MRCLVLSTFALFIGCAPEEQEEFTTPTEDDYDYGFGSDTESETESETESGTETNTDSNPETEDTNRCPDSWVLTYGLTGRIDITNTPLNIGNADAPVGGLDSDEIVLRIPDDNGFPSNGTVLMTYFELLEDFQVSVNLLGEITIISDLLATSENECGIASGQLSNSTLRWDDCDYGPGHGTTAWSPEESAYGPGCVQDFHVEGVVECVDDSFVASCEDGWLDEGDNMLNEVYNQPLLNFDFEDETLERFTMKGINYGTEVPTDTNNRTWLTLEGVLKDMRLEATPDCLCGN